MVCIVVIQITTFHLQSYQATSLSGNSSIMTHTASWALLHVNYNVHHLHMLAYHHSSLLRQLCQKQLINVLFVKMLLVHFLLIT